MNHRRLACLAVLLLAVVGYGQDKRPAPMRGAAKPAEPLPAAALVIGVNETVGSVAEPGWPIIVSAALVAEEDGAKVTVPAGLRLIMTDESNKEVALRFDPIPRPADADAAQAYYWLAAEAATKGLAPGRYNVTLAPAEGELKGLRIESGDVRVVTTDPARGGDLGSLKIQRSLLLDKQDEALAEADRLIAADATNSGAWIAKGDMLMMRDKPDEALAAYDSALKLVEKTDKEPLFIMERRRAAFFGSLEKRKVLPATKPAP